MRIPGFTRKKSSKGPTNDDAQTTYLQPNGSGSNASLNRTRSGASDLTDFGANAAAPRTSIDQSVKRSFFKRAHSRSLSSDAQRKLDLAGQDEQTRRAVPATISVAGGHPLRQQTLPQDLEPAKGKRPLLFSKRAATSIAPSVQPQQLSPASSRGVSPLVDPAGKAAQAAQPQDSFQLKGFRSVSGVKEEKPTLSSLVDADIVSSPVSTRPNSPSLGHGGSYFDNMPTQRAGDGTPSGSHDRAYSSGSISVAKFREARAARSSSSLASSERGPTTGLKLDLPPPITMDYNRPCLSSIQPAGRQSGGSSYTASPVSAPAVSSTFPAAAVSSAQQNSPSSITESQEVLAPPVDGPRSAPLLASLASHPDNTLPLPPLPADPRRSFQGHSRRTSTQSITSLSSAFGGWLNSTTSNLGIAFSVEDVQKAINSGASVLRAASPVQEHHPIFSRAADAPKAKEDEQEVISPVATGPTKEELEVLLGGKVLPPPPSETGNDELGPAVRAKSASPTPILSRTSSLTNLSSGLSTAKHLFSSGVARIAKASKVADDSSSESSVDLQASKPFKVPNSSPAKKRLFGDSSSDEESQKDEEDSDDSDVECKRAERAQVFPPPRPVTQQEREHVYRSAQASPFVSPHGSTVDLRSSAVPLVQPVPRIPALTTSALTAFNDEEEENIPLSAIRGRRSGAMSELGLAMPRTMLGTPPCGNPGLSRPQQQQARSALGMSLSGNACEKPIASLASSSTSNLPLASEGMSRSLSAFNTTTSDIALNPRTYMRSVSSQGAQPRPSNITLGSLIDAELSRSHHSSDVSAGLMDPGLASRPSSSSDTSSIPKTPSETSSAVKAGQSDLSMEQHRSTRSDLGLMSSRPSGPRAPAASSLSVSRHGKSSSVPLASLPESGSLYDRMKERHRAEARKSSLDPGHGSSSAPPDATAISQYAPQPVYQEMPAPPGVDPQLYASLPNDQKQALQLRSAQLLAMMQGYAMQAQAHMLAQPQQHGFPTQNLPFLPSSFPYPMQMPMMGSPLSSFPSFPSFPSFAGQFGYPSASSSQLPSHVQHPYVPHSSASAIGLPSQVSPQRPGHQQQRLP